MVSRHGHPALGRGPQGVLGHALLPGIDREVAVQRDPDPDQLPAHSAGTL